MRKSGHEKRIWSCPGSWESFAMSRDMRAGHESTYIPRIAHSNIRIASSADYIENPFFPFLSFFFHTHTLNSFFDTYNRTVPSLQELTLEPCALHIYIYIMAVFLNSPVFITFQMQKHLKVHKSAQ